MTIDRADWIAPARRWFARPSPRVARELLGALLVRASPEGTVAGRIVETEAYLARADPASHAFRGRTARNASMFGPAGHAYVYFVYGVHHCLNVVTGEEGVGEAVLVRAVEPLEGLELLRQRRGASVRDAKLCDGPGKLAQAFAIDRADDGADLLRGDLRILVPARRSRGRERVVVGPRVGISQAVELPLRFRLVPRAE